MTINDNHDVIDIIRCVCFKCKYFDRQELTCPAFGIDILILILRGKQGHTKPLPNQNNDIVFEPIEK